MPDPGGIQTVMQTLVEAAPKTDKVGALVSRRIGLGITEEYEGLKVFRSLSLGTLLAMPLAPFYPFHLLLKSRQVDIVDYHYPFPLVDLAIAFGFPENTALVVHWHADIIAQQRTLKVVRPAIFRTLKRADRIIVASEEHIRHSPYLQPFRKKCVVIPFGVDVSLWRTITPKQTVFIDVLKRKYPKMILCVGRLVSYKGIEYLIDAIKNTDANLCIIGVGPLGKKLKQQAKSLGIENKVHFIGKVNQAVLKCFYHACSVFAFPSIAPNEAFGVVQLEAMACKKPVINTSIISAVPTIARHQKEGLTVPPKDVAALSGAIEFLLTNPQVAQSYGQSGLARVLENFSQEVFVSKTQALYRKVHLERSKKRVAEEKCTYS